MNQKVRVLILDNSSAVTGAFRSIYSSTQIIQSDYEFYYGVSANSSLVDFLKSEKKNVATFPFLELQRNYKLIFYLPRLLLNTWRILRFIRNYDIRIVHVNDLYNMCGVMVKVFSRDVKVVYHVRLMKNSYVGTLYKFFVRIIARYAEVIIAVSEAVKNELSELKIKAVVIYDGVLSEKYVYPVQKNKNSSVTLLYLSNFIDGKGHNYAIQAFAIAQKQIPELKMIMAGGDLGLEKNVLTKNKLIRGVERMGLSERIIFYDFVENVEKIMRESDIFLNFSESESFSLTCLEALTYGVPLIASDCGGPRELFEHEVSGLLVPNQNVTAMAEAIIRLSRDSKLRDAFAMAGQQYASKKFDLTESARVLCSLYAQINQ